MAPTLFHLGEMLSSNILQDIVNVKLHIRSKNIANRPTIRI